MKHMSFTTDAGAQENDPFVRVVNLVIDSTRLEAFNAALKEDIEEAVCNEPGVYTLYAAYDKSNPTHVTVFEVYANEAAHKAHQQTAHFIKYKNIINGMVKSTVRTELVPISLANKPKRAKQ